MKRSLVTTLVIGVAVAIVVGVLHATKAIAGFEAGVTQLVSDYASATRVVGEKWQYLLVLVTATGVAWLSLRNLPRSRSYPLFGFLLIELLALSGVCSLFRVFFQPVPCIFAIALAVAAAEGWTAFLQRDRSYLVWTLFANRLSKKEFHRVSKGTFDGQAQAYEATVADTMKFFFRKAIRKE